MICLVESTGKRLENQGQENKQGFDDKKNWSWTAFPMHTRGENINTSYAV